MNDRSDQQDVFTFSADIDIAPLPTPSQRNRAKEHLMNHIVSSTSLESPPTALPGRKHRRARWFTFTAATAAAAAIAAVVITVPGDTGLTGSKAAGAAELRRIAAVAAERPLPGSGDILHFRSSNRWGNFTVEASGKTSSSFDPVEREVWVRPDGSWVLSENRAGQQTIEDNFNEGDDWGSYYLRDLPADATREAVERAIRTPASEDRTGRTVDTEVVTLATDALRETNLSPNIRSKLFEIIADSPILSRVGTESDRTGRPGTAFEWTDDNGTRQRIIIDPKTSQLLEEQTFNKAGEVEQYGTYLVLEYVEVIPSEVLTAAVPDCGAGSEALIQQCLAEFAGRQG